MLHTLSKLGNTPVAQDVNKLCLVRPPLLLSCFIQGLGGIRLSVMIHTA